MQALNYLTIPAAKPDSTAVVWDENNQLTYRELTQAVCQRSHYFASTLKLKKGDVVGVLAQRGPEYLINMLALWTIGAVYLPLSDAWQETNAIVNRLRDSKARCLLTVSELYPRYAAETHPETQDRIQNISIVKQVVCIDKVQNELKEFPADFPKAITLLLDDNAYIFSSSGTTGKPKLICLPHEGILARIDDHIAMMGLNQQQGVLGFIDFGFDASIVEMLIAVRTGATYYIAPRMAEQVHQKLPEFITTHSPNIQVAILLPSVLKGLKPAQCSGLTKIVTMGEACLLEQLKIDGWFNQASIYNGYGPTETTFGASLTPLSEYDSTPSIHCALTGITLYLRESFSLIFASGKEVEKDKDVFYLSYSEKNKQWQYDIQYNLATSNKIPSCGMLNSDLNEFIALAKQGDVKSETALLSHLILETVKNPRIIAKSDDSKNRYLLPYDLGKAYFGKELPQPIRGEIIIAGWGIGTYLNLDDKTKEKFRTHEEAKLEGFNEPRLFLSGDVADYDGTHLAYKNRKDNQLKRYGILVTLDEIESELKKCHTYIKDVVVLLKQERLVAFMIPQDLKLINKINHRATGQAVTNAIYKDKKVDKKFQPHVCLWVESLPTRNNKISRQIADYEKLKLLRLLPPDLAAHDETLQNITKVWQELLEGSLSLLNLDAITYDLDTRFDELGGDSLLTSIMIQKVWELENEKKTPAPNDFANLIVHNPTLNGIAQTLTYYHQPLIQPLSADTEGVPIFMFESVEAVNTTAPLYQIIFPEHFPYLPLTSKNLKALLILLKVQCRKIQTEGPCHFVCTEADLLLAHPLVAALAKTGNFTYLTVVKLDMALSRSSKNTIAAENLKNRIEIIQDFNFKTKNYFNLTPLWNRSSAATPVDSESVVVNGTLPSATIEAINKRLSHTSVRFENMQVNWISDNELQTAVIALYQERIKHIVLERFELLKKNFLQTTEKYAEIFPNFGVMDAESNKTCWLIGEAGAGKTTFLKQHLMNLSKTYHLLPLHITGITTIAVFETALEKIFPRWQWSCLKEQKLLILIEDYDAIARLDCPDLWQQAKDTGFFDVTFIISCRKSYWNTYKKTLREFEKPDRFWQLHFLSPRIPPEFGSKLRKLGLPLTYLAVTLYQRIVQTLSPQASATDIGYAWLVEWFKREYNRTPISDGMVFISEADYVHQAFETLQLLNTYYMNKKEGVWLALQPSHWELGEKLPCVHALPLIKSILPLLQSQALAFNFQLHNCYSVQAYEDQLQKPLRMNDLVLIRNPHTKQWDWRYVRSASDDYQSFKIIQEPLPNWLDTSFRQQYRKLALFPEDEQLCQSLLPEVKEYIRPWHPLQFSKLPNGWEKEVEVYLDQYQKMQAELAIQGLNSADIEKLPHYHAFFEDKIWNEVDAAVRYHLLPLQHVPGSIPIFMFHPLTGETPVHYRSLAEALGPKQSVYVFQMGIEDKQTTIASKAKLYYEYIVKIQAKGPYVLIGWSFGAIVAYAVACLLEQQNHKVDWVINLDSPPPNYIKDAEIDKRALDMIETLAQKIYQVPLDTHQLEQAVQQVMADKHFINPKEEKAMFYFKKSIEQINLSYGKQYQNFCHALQKAHVNLQVYYDFGMRLKDNPKTKLKARLWVVEAAEKQPLLNETDFTTWNNYCQNPVKYDTVNASHFRLFNAELFNKLRPVLKQYQAQPHYSLKKRLKAYRRKRLTEFEEQQKHPIKGIYIEAMADEEQTGKKPFSLDEEIMKFLTPQNQSTEKAQCFLLQGEPGSGKSHYGQRLEYRLWQDKTFIPLFIRLKPGIKQYLKTALLDAFLTKAEFNQLYITLKNSSNPKEILRKFLGAPLLIIFDGYDEALITSNFYKQENLQQWEAKVFISCRTYTVNYHTMNEQFGDGAGELQTAYLQAFKQEEIEYYLYLYYLKTGIKLDIEQWETMPDKNMIQNPLLLSIAVELWEQLPNHKNRAALYQAFFKKLFEEDQKKIINEQGICPSVNLNEAFTGYTHYQALRYWQSAHTTTELISQNRDSHQAQKSNRLGLDSEGRINHVTFWEYQLASAIVHTALNHEFNDLETAYPSILGGLSLCSNFSLLGMIDEVSRLLPRNQLDRLRHHFLLTVYASRYKHPHPEKDKAKVIAAANAISILNAMRVPFSGLDLSLVRIAGANLLNAILHRTNLSGANLKDVILKGTYLNEANLDGTQMIGVEFGEGRPLECDGNVEAICYSHNGHMMAVGCKTVDLYKKQGDIFKKIATLTKHTENITSVAFSSDGKILISGGWDSRVCLWDTQTYEIITSFTHFMVESVAFNPNGQQLASGGRDNTIRLWSIQTHQIIVVLAGHTSSVFGIAFSPNGQLLASGSQDGTVRLWDTKVFINLIILKHKFSVKNVVFSSDGRQLASEDTGTVYIWDTQLDDLITFNENTSPVSRDVFPYIRELHGDNVITLERKSIVSSLAFSPNGHLLALGALNGSVYLWDIRTIKEIAIFNHGNFLRSVTFSPDGCQLALGGRYNVCFWDTKIYQTHGALTKHVSFDYSIAFSPNRKLLALGGDNVYLQDAQTYQVIATLTGHKDLVKTVTFSQNGRLLASGDQDGAIYLWDTQSYQIIATLRGDTHWVTSIAFSPDGRILASGDGHRIIYLWDTQSYQLIATLTGVTNVAFAFSPDGKILASGDQDGTVSLWDIQSYQLITTLTGHAEESTAVAFSSDGKFVASGGRDTALCLWDSKSYQLIATLTGHTDKVKSVAFSPDGRILASGSGDKTIRLWDNQSYQLIITLIGHTSSVACVVFSSDGLQLASISEDNNPAIYIWGKVVTTSRTSEKWVVISRCANSSFSLYAENTFLKEAILSKKNLMLLKQRGANCDLVPKPIYSPIFIDDKFAVFSTTLFSMIPEEIFYHCFAKILSHYEWQTLACLDKASYHYFGRLNLLARTLTSYSMLQHYSQHWRFKKSEDSIEFSFMDGFNEPHTLKWPYWHLNGIMPLHALSPISHNNVKVTELLSADLVKNAQIEYIFKETSPRRLIYLLSMSYLLSEALTIALEMGLTCSLKSSFIALSDVYALYSDYNSDYLKRLIYFLSRHGFVEYDKKQLRIRLTMLGATLDSLFKPEELLDNNYATKKVMDLAEKCNIHYANENTHLILSGDSSEIVGTLLLLGDFTGLLHLAAREKLFDVIASGKNTIEFLCDSELNIDFDTLYHLTQFQFLKWNEYGLCELTALGEYLRSNHPESLQPTLAMLDQAWWNAVDKFHFTFEIGWPAFEIANEKSFFEYLACNPAVQANFNQGLACLTKNQDKLIVNHLKKYIENDCHSIVDIAGGAGGLLQAIQMKFPEKKFTLYEKMSVIKDIQSQQKLQTQSLNLVSGDFFRPYKENNLPENKDLYLIKGVLHDFNDNECLQILRHVREVIPRKSRLCLIERTLPETKEPHINHYGDLLMMMLLTGRERFRDEWFTLLLHAGFEWINYENPLEVEDHSIMLCKPSLPEISHGLSFFKSEAKLQNMQQLSQQLFDLIDSSENILFYLDEWSRLLSKDDMIAIIDSIFKSTGNKNHTGLYLIAFFAHFIQKLHLGELPRTNSKQDIQNLLTSIIHLTSYEEETSIDAWLQQLPWIISFITEKRHEYFLDTKPEIKFFPEDKNNWGNLRDRQISTYTFRFFDAKTLKKAGSSSKNYYNLQKRIEKERSENIQTTSLVLR